MCILFAQAILLMVIADLEIEDVRFGDNEPPRYDTFRIEEVVLSSGGYPVFTGNVVDTDPEDDNRLFTMREYVWETGSPAKQWHFNFEGGCWDDDGYAILQYMTDDDPPEERFLGVGFFQVDLSPGDPESREELGLAVLLDDEGDTVCSPHLFGSIVNWTNACCRDAVYIGGWEDDDEVYATCGWYYTDIGLEYERGFVEIAYENVQIRLIEDSNIEGSWEKIIHDSAEEFLVVGGTMVNETRACGDLRIGYVDLNDSPCDITDQSYWGPGTYNLLEGPLVQLDDGFYAYLGNGLDGSTEAVAVTLWSWDWQLSPSMVLDDSDLYETEEYAELEDYSDIYVFAADYISTVNSERIVMLIYGVRNSNLDECILVANTPVNPVRKTLGTFAITDVLVVSTEEEYSVEARDFTFTSLSPVEGVGGGNAVYGSDQDFWLFRITEEE